MAGDEEATPMTDITALVTESAETLAEALRAAGVEVGSVGGQAFREHVAARLLASDWMKRHAAEVRAEAVRPALDLAAEWESWASTQSTPRIDAFRDAAERLRAALAEEGEGRG